MKILVRINTPDGDSPEDIINTYFPLCPLGDINAWFVSEVTPL